MEKELKYKAVSDIFSLREIAEKHKGTLEELCKELGGHNLEDELFDVNYRSITATVIKSEQRGFYISDTVEVWNSDDCEGTFEINELCKLTVNEFAEYIVENFNISQTSMRIVDNICNYAEKWAKGKVNEFLFDMLGSTMGLSDKEISAVQDERLQQQEPQFKAVYDGQEYSFDFASKVFIFDTGLSCGFNNQQELFRYVDFVHSCYCKDENETPLERLARWTAKNWEEVKELPERQVLTKFYMRWANETTDEDD